jgi:hypothetical protein
MSGPESYIEDLEARYEREQERVGKAGNDDQEKRKGIAQQLIEIGTEQHLFADDDGVGYVQVHVGAHKEVYQIESQQTRDWLAAEFFRRTEKGANRNAVADAIATLNANAKFGRSARQAVHLRTGVVGNAMFIDTGDEVWSSWRITATEIDRDYESECLFRRSPKSLPLPEPDGADFSPIWDLIPCRPEQQPLIAAYVAGALRPRSPYPVLLFTSEQGTGKSEGTRRVKSITDPSAVPLRSPPREERDLCVAALNSHVLAYDNLSGCPAWLSDGICRLATGGGIAARQLFTDTTEVLLQIARPIILNGIDDLANRPDLAERSLLVELMPISNRRTEVDLRRAFERSSGRIFGAVLESLKLAMRDARSIDIGQKPRMADFATWAAAAMPALGFTAADFLTAYRMSIRSATLGAIESSPVAIAVIELSERNPAGWQGTVGELLIAIKPDHDRTFPSTPEKLSNALRRLAPAFRQSGINVDLSERGSRGRMVTVQKLRASSDGCDGSSPFHKRKDVDEMGTSLHRAGMPAQPAQPAHPSTTANDGCVGCDGSDGFHDGCNVESSGKDQHDTYQQVRETCTTSTTVTDDEVLL